MHARELRVNACAQLGDCRSSWVHHALLCRRDCFSVRTNHSVGYSGRKGRVWGPKNKLKGIRERHAPGADVAKRTLLLILLKRIASLLTLILCTRWRHQQQHVHYLLIRHTLRRISRSKSSDCVQHQASRTVQSDVKKCGCIAAPSGNHPAMTSTQDHGAHDRGGCRGQWLGLLRGANKLLTAMLQ